MNQPTFFWHDYETTGADPMRDRPLQFAGIRTDMNLNVVGDPVMHYCQPATDCLPHPVATLITGITPQQAQCDGLIEAEFAARVNDELAQPGTCGVGYNSLRFDDTLTRFLLYRNFYDAYAREWQNGNSRWDIIDLARMCHALRPAGIQWPTREDGAPSFRLEDLATANHLDQKHAHDALSDVEATIGLARLLRQHQPRLWDWYLGLRRKQAVVSLIDIANRTPLLHVSSRYPASRGCLAIVVPLAMHPTRNTEVIVATLDRDPEPLLRLAPDAIAHRLFTRSADLPEDIERVGLRTVHINRSPALAPLSVLKQTDTTKLAFDVEQSLAWAEHLRTVDGLAAKARAVYDAQSAMGPADDPDWALYDGFTPDSDRRLLDQVRATPPEQLGAHLPFHDARYPELLFRYRARNWPDTLNSGEHGRWERWRARRLSEESHANLLTLPSYFACINALRAEPGRSGRDRALLDQLEVWGRELKAGLETGSGEGM